VFTDKNISGTIIQSGSIEPYEIGTVDTAFKLIGPDHKIEI
jgi:catabolite regulation protein CreA